MEYPNQSPSSNSTFSFIPLANELHMVLVHDPLDEQITRKKMEIFHSELEITRLELQIKNKKKHRDDLNEELRFLATKKNHEVKKNRVVNQNKRRLNADELNDELDEMRNERPEGTCQGFNGRNHSRCNKLGVEHLEGKLLCDRHINQLLREKAGYGGRLH